MPKLTDSTIRNAILQAFVNEERWAGFVIWKPSAAEKLLRDFPGHRPPLVNSMVVTHLTSNGDIKFAKETRDEWLQCGFHYDVVLPGPDGKRIYAEMVLVNDGADDPDDLCVHVVSCHKTS